MTFLGLIFAVLLYLISFIVSGGHPGMGVFIVCCGFVLAGLFADFTR